MDVVAERMTKVSRHEGIAEGKKQGLKKEVIWHSNCLNVLLLMNAMTILSVSHMMRNIALSS